jgi:IclR family KDG regulon transcriptional repressor
MAANYLVPMVENTVRVLQALSESDRELTLREICARTEVSTTSAYRILYTLSKLGFINKNTETGKYQLGPKITEIAWRPRKVRSLIEISRPYLREIHRHYNETVNLALINHEEIVYVEIIESGKPFRMAPGVGSRVPIHATALGKAIAPFLDPATLNKMLDRCSWTRFTPHTITSRSQFLKAIAVIKKQRVSFDNEEAEVGASCLASPVIDETGCALGAISVSAPTHRIAPKVKALARDLRQACVSISNSLRSQHLT